MWTPTMDDALVDAFLHQHNEGNRVNGTFTPKAYEPIVKELKEKIGQRVDKDKVKNRRKTLKANFVKCFDLFKNGMSGFAWSPITNMWSAEPEVWARLIEAHPHAAEWKSKTVPNYDKMVILYGQDRATGERAETPIEMGKRMSSTLEEEFFETIDGIEHMVSTNEVTIDAFDSCNVDNVEPMMSSEIRSKKVEFKGKSKRIKRSKNDIEPDNIKEAFTIVADALKEGNSVMDKSTSTQRLPMLEDEVWKLLVDLKIYQDLMKKAYLFFVERPEKVRALFGCLMDVRKDILLMMLVD